MIATPNGAAPEIVTPGVNGYLAATIDDLVDAVRRIPDLCRRRCRLDAVNRFSLQSMVIDHEQVYRRLLAAHRQAATTTDQRHPVADLAPPATG